MQRAVARLEQHIDELNQLNPATASEDQVSVLETSIEESLDHIFGRGTNDYNRYVSAATLDHGPLTLVLGGGASRRDTRRYWAEGRTSAISKLKLAVSKLQRRIEYPDPAGTAAPRQSLYAHAPAPEGLLSMFTVPETSLAMRAIQTS
jgi:hypothetical protein